MCGSCLGTVVLSSAVPVLSPPALLSRHDSLPVPTCPPALLASQPHYSLLRRRTLCSNSSRALHPLQASRIPDSISYSDTLGTGGMTLPGRQVSTAYFTQWSTQTVWGNSTFHISQVGCLAWSAALECTALRCIVTTLYCTGRSGTGPHCAVLHRCIHHPYRHNPTTEPNGSECMRYPMAGESNASTEVEIVTLALSESGWDVSVTAGPRCRASLSIAIDSYRSVSGLIAL
jgi:hypothetical protein